MSVNAETSVAPVSAWSAAGAQGKRPEFSAERLSNSGLFSGVIHKPARGFAQKVKMLTMWFQAVFRQEPEAEETPLVVSWISLKVMFALRAA